MSLLSVSNLQKSFQEIKAVNHISLEVERGQVLAILGESGSGKTTLLHLIAGLYEPDFGELLLDNRPIIPPSQKLIAGHPDIKLVRQDYGLFPNISIRENIAYELRYYEETYRNKRVDKLLKLTGLSAFQHHLPRQVSGGEQQRAVIAKAIAEKTKLLLLDEPFSHLDAVNKRKLKSELVSLVRSEKIGCIFVTHDAADAYGMADRLLIMQKGKALQYGTPEKIYQKPINKYVAEMTGEVIDKKTIETVFSASSKYFIRPEAVMIDHNSSIKAIVTAVKFFGAYYEISLSTAQNKLKCYSFEKLLIGNSIGISLKNKVK